jgi:hypothetical protein
MSNRMRSTAILALTLLFTLCIQQCKNPVIEEVQPELSDEGFIDIVNTILVEKVSADLFDFSTQWSHVYIRNIYDHNGKEAHVSVGRYVTEIHISVSPGHFTGIRQAPEEGPASPMEIPLKPPEMVDARGLFTPQIECQVDLTPPSDFRECRKYDIVIMTYEGTLEVCRGVVSIHFKNIGALSPTPTPPGPRSLISKVIYYGFISILVFVVVFTALVIIKLRRRRKP